MRPSLRSCPAPARPGSSRGGGREAGGFALEGAPALRLGAWGPWGQGCGRGTVPQGSVSGLEKHHREARGGTGARSPRHARAGVSPLELLPKKAAQQLRPPWYRKHVPGGTRPWPAGGPEGEPWCEWGVTPESWDTGGPCVDGQRPLPEPHTQQPRAHLSPSRSPLRRAWLARASESQRPGATRWASEPPGSPGAGRAVGCRVGSMLLVRLWPRPAVHPPEAQRPTGLSSGRWPGGQQHPLRKDGGSPAGDSSPTCPAVGLGQGRGPPGGRGPGRPQGGPEGPCPAARTVPLPTPRQLSQAAGHGRGARWGLVRKSASSLS